MTQLIEEGKAGAVLVWDESRLFRDEDMIQPAIFTKLCKMQHVLVLTNEVVFDFNHPSRDDEKRFRDEAQAVADYLGKQIKKMNKARDRVALRGDMLDTACQPGSCSMMN